MRARRPTSAMPKPFLCCERAFCCSMVLMCRGGDLTSFDVMRSVAGWDEAIKVLLQYYSVLQSTTPVLLCTAKCYSSTTLYYKVLLQYYSLLHSTTTYYSSTTLYYKVLLCTTKYYSSTTLYYKVLLQYYSVLHSTTTSTTLYYKAAFMINVRRIWNVIYNARSNRSHPPTSRNTAPAKQNDCDDWSASHMKRHLQWAEQQESPSTFTKYCACHAKWISWLIRLTYETSFRMRGASKVNLEPHQIYCACHAKWISWLIRVTHQILRLPRKMTVMIDPHHIWNVIYNERSNRNHNPSSPNTAPATQNECHQWSASHMKRHFHCAEQVKSPFKLTNYCACHAKWISRLIRVTYETSFRMRGASKVNLEPQQILRLPRSL